ncbi:n-acetylglucosamine-6-phosphate deacetylase [Achlya hypogyna]|uniref:N-acetylglucosamine-6-phosphate deacetylase n=1 Tax=Achlya hypogyna TaxID=1202772 RepID=A0A1V9Z2P8_ACHHY|nr:n-acetylglucosamine-6-phosphate deacetylase [Achlya hypogyna]
MTSSMLSDSTLKIENVRVLRGGKLVPTFLWVENGKIMDPQARFWRASTAPEYGPQRVVDGRGLIVAPGFLDIQINGAYGHDFTDRKCSPENILEVRQRLLETGVTAFCPTVISSSAETYAEVLPKFDRTNDGHIVGAANMIGLHLEGPFINRERKGAHKEEVFAEPEEGLKSLEARYGPLDSDRVAFITMAPELKGALPAIAELRARGIVVSAGHSSANFQQAKLGLDAGASMLTHLFNAMASFHHRDPGLVGLLGATTARPYYGLILDGIHSHPTSCRIAQASHPSGLVLVTDCMAAMGMPDGSYELADLAVDVKDGRVYLHNTTTIAGSVVQMDACIRTLRQYTNCSVEYALEAATLHPATALGLAPTKGTLEFGADADFVLLNDDLEVLQTYIAGVLVYDRGDTPQVRYLVHDDEVHGPLMTHYDLDDDRAMDKAAGAGQLHLLRQLHAKGTSTCTSHAMDMAAANGHLDIVRFLHENREEGCSTNAMDLAASHGHLEVVRYLHEHRTEGCTAYAMKAATENGHHEVVDYLIQQRNSLCVQDVYSSRD